jgi:hypothetical protein
MAGSFLESLAILVSLPDGKNYRSGVCLADWMASSLLLIFLLVKFATQLAGYAAINNIPVFNFFCQLHSLVGPVVEKWNSPFRAPCKKVTDSGFG